MILNKSASESHTLPPVKHLWQKSTGLACEVPSCTVKVQAAQKKNQTLPDGMDRVDWIEENCQEVPSCEGQKEMSDDSGKGSDDVTSFEAAAKRKKKLKIV